MMGVSGTEEKRSRLFFGIALALTLVATVAVAVYGERVSREYERQVDVMTDLLVHRAGRLLSGHEREDAGIITSIMDDLQIPFVITDTLGRPVLWNESVVGIPLPGYEELSRVDPQRPANPAIRDVLRMSAGFDQRKEPFAILSPESERLGTLHYGRSDLSERVSLYSLLVLVPAVLICQITAWSRKSDRT